MNDLTNPNYWRASAEEARARAEQFANPKAKMQMLGVAAGYEQMAAIAEKLLFLLNPGAKK